MQHGDTANTSAVMPSSLAQLDLRPLLERLLDTAPADAGQAAAWFHWALADALAHWVIQAAQQTQLRSVCLGGGCFFNQLLTQRLRTQLERAGLQVFLPQKHSCGDAGLALGQAWVAAHSLNASAHTNAAVPTPTQNSFKPEQLQCA
jgi:hydrogenase maturation protein HypF